jgi:hypothetical protein
MKHEAVSSLFELHKHELPPPHFPESSSTTLTPSSTSSTASSSSTSIPPSTSSSTPPPSTSSSSTSSERSYIIDKIVPSPQEFGFRSKLTPHHPSLRPGTPLEAIGFLKRGRAGAVVNMKTCPIATDAINEEFSKMRAQMIGKTVNRFRRGSSLMIRHSLVAPREKAGAASGESSLKSADVEKQERLALFIKKLKAGSGSLSSASGNDMDGSKFQQSSLASRLGLVSTPSEPQPVSKSMFYEDQPFGLKKTLKKQTIY